MRDDLKPVPGRPGVFEDKRGRVYVNDETWAQWEANRAAVSRRHQAMVAARERQFQQQRPDRPCPTCGQSLRKAA